MPRERYQDPTLQQSKNGCWFIRPWVDVLTEDGLTRKKKQIVLGPSSIGRREATTLKRAVMDTINRASYVVQSQVPFKKLLDEYCERHIPRQSSSTRAKYESLLKNHIRPAFDPLDLYEVTGRRVDDWLQTKEKAGLSWSTRTDIRNLLSGIFAYAIKWKLYQDDNPIAAVSVGKKHLVREKRKLTDDQTRRLMAALPGDVRNMCHVALFCTLRISEVLGIQEKHIDFTEGVIRVEQRFYRGDLSAATKTDRSRRSVPMGYLADEIRRLCFGDPERFVFQVATRPKWGRKQAICRDDRDILQHFIRPAAKELGFYWKGFGWHAFRREAITAISAELGIGQAMTLGGHSSADMSLAYTLQDREKADAAIRTRQEKIMGKPQGRIV